MRGPSLWPVPGARCVIGARRKRVKAREGKEKAATVAQLCARHCGASAIYISDGCRETERQGKNRRARRLRLEWRAELLADAAPL